DGRPAGRAPPGRDGPGGDGGAGGRVRRRPHHRRQPARRLADPGVAAGPGGVVLIRVLIVDDQAVIRTGLRTMLDHEEDLTIVGEASGAEEALHLAESAKPDVVLMD